MSGYYYHSLLRHSRVRRVSRCSAFGQTRGLTPYPHGWFGCSDIVNFTTNWLSNNTSLQQEFPTFLEDSVVPVRNLPQTSKGEDQPFRGWRGWVFPTSEPSRGHLGSTKLKAQGL